jgi:hypothetical protein
MLSYYNIYSSIMVMSLLCHVTAGRSMDLFSATDITPEKTLSLKEQFKNKKIELYSSFLYEAASEGDAELVEKWAKKALVDFPHGILGYTALHCAAQKGHQTVVEILLKNGADINAHSRGLPQCPITLAEKAGHTELVAFLKSRGAEYPEKHIDWEFAGIFGQ